MTGRLDTQAHPKRPIVKRSPALDRPFLAGWLGRCLAIVWLLVIALWVQFAAASIVEMEPQAVTLGTIVAAMLTVGGLTLWGLERRSRSR